MKLSKLSKLISLLVIVYSLAACAEPPYNNLDNKQLQAMLAQGVPIYDIRRPEEWKQTGVVADSNKLTFVDGSGRLKPDFMEKFSKVVGKNDPVILICRTGNRTGVLSRLLVEQMGYTQVNNVEHGISSWISAGLPVTKSR